MSIITKLKRNFVIWHANRVKLPSFAASPQIRKRVTFSGIVQNVGFRLEMYCLAERLQVSGWVRNLEDGRVEAEIQGEEAKVDFLCDYMQKLKRASVKDVKKIDIPIKEEENDFLIVT